jgi:hypothetical protein
MLPMGLLKSFYFRDENRKGKMAAGEPQIVVQMNTKKKVQ